MNFLWRAAAAVLISPVHDCHLFHLPAGVLQPESRAQLIEEPAQNLLCYPVIRRESGNTSSGDVQDI
ncbi:hypothetical protein [Oceanobacillus sp. J11TS1]|uniref:hypothetical protein n=1 Tax=Oceanobacillus sp. J11TS1 TaxID=2807191 RepID=UPI001BB388F7|nr:hypothetical protein [Oceanobacillus sp. J11TS1]